MKIFFKFSHTLSWFLNVNLPNNYKLFQRLRGYQILFRCNPMLTLEHFAVIVMFVPHKECWPPVHLEFVSRTVATLAPPNLLHLTCSRLENQMTKLILTVSEIRITRIWSSKYLGFCTLALCLVLSSLELKVIPGPPGVIKDG